MRSIRAYLLSRLLGGAAFVLVGAGISVYIVVARSLEAQFDRNLADRVQGFASILFQEGEHVEFEFSDELMPEYEREVAPAFFEVRFAGGRLLERSNSLGDGTLPPRGEPGFEPQFWTAPMPDGRSGRFVTQLIEVHHVYPEEGPYRPTPATIQVTLARGREGLLAAERTVLLSCLGMALALLFLLALLSWRSVKRGLEPANRLAAALDRIQVDDLPERVDVGDLPRELRPVSQKTNALIRRVDIALERERRTAADIAHELRTPLSELLTVSEVALRNGRDAEGSVRALEIVRGVAWRMGRSVSTLLKLARLEMGAEAFDQTDVDLGAIVREPLRSLASIERERGIQVENRIDPHERVVGDADVLRIVVSNLLSNALYYSPARGSVECRLERSGDRWRLVVANDAADLRADDLGSLSEPFWRKDSARADRNRSGLGLALSSALAERAQMRLGFELEGGRFRAILSGGNGGGGSPQDRAESARVEPPVRTGDEGGVGT